MQKKTNKVTKQFYRVKKDGRLSKNSDFTQRIEKPTVEEISASSTEQIAPDVEYVSNNIVEQKPSSVGGQDDLNRFCWNRSNRCPDRSDRYDRSDRRQDRSDWYLQWIWEFFEGQELDKAKHQGAPGQIWKDGSHPKAKETAKRS